MITKIDHIAIAVKNLDETRQRMESIFGAKFILEEFNEKGQYRVNIFQVGDKLISLLESTSRDGFVAQHIERFGEGVQHMGVEVESIDAATEEFKAKGIKHSSLEEVEGVRKEVLVSGRNAFGVILQVMEWLGDYKESTPEERMLKAWKQ